jgi:hypothetical protein
VFLHPDRVAAGLPDLDPNDPEDEDPDAETVLSAG